MSGSQIGSIRSQQNNNTCIKFGLINKRKKPIQCSHCQRWALLTCVGILRAQVDSLPNWHCLTCISGESYTSSDPSDSDSRILPAGGLESYLAHLKSVTPIIRYIPKSVRNVLADKLSENIDTAISHSSDTAWTELLVFTYKYLRMPSNENNRRHGNLASHIRMSFNVFYSLTAILHRERSCTQLCIHEFSM